jgi:hypothetical protein
MGLTSLLLLTSSLFLADSASYTEFTQGDPERLALIIGINQYEHNGTDDQWRDLTGCVNDAERVKKVLKKRFGFQDKDILLLTDKQATHEGIVRAFYDHLIQKAGKNTEVLFWYSGHGSRVPDGSGIASAEYQGKDSTFVTFNSRSKGNGHSFDFTDDELHSLIRALCGKTDRLTVITDSCHSGGVTRGPAGRSSRAAKAGSQSLTFNDIESFWPSAVPFLEDGDVRRNAPLSYVHIAACSSIEEAEEIEVKDSRGRARRFGAMSFFLTQALEKMPKGTTYRELAKQVGLQVNTFFEGQNVQAEGSIDRVIFQGQFADPPPGFAAVADPEARFPLEIEGGSIHFLRKGSIMKMIDPVADKVLGNAKITRVYSESAQAKWVGEEPKFAQAMGLRAIEIERPVGDDPVVLFVDQGKLEDEIVALLQKEGAGVVEIQREPGPGVDYQLFPPHGDAGLFQMWTTTSSLPLWEEQKKRSRAENISRGVLLALKQEIRFKQILNLASTGNSMSISASFQPISDKSLEDLRDSYDFTFAKAQIRHQGSRGEDTNHEGNQVLVDTEGDNVYDMADFVINLPGGKGTKPMHVTVLCVSENRSITIAWPPAEERATNLIEPGVPKPIQMMVYSDPDWPLSRPMRDRYLVIATEKQADFSPFVSKSSRLVAKPKTSGTRGGADGMPDVVAQALMGRQTRGGRSLKPRSVGFSILAVDAHMVTE